MDERIIAEFTGFKPNAQDLTIINKSLDELYLSAPTDSESSINFKLLEDSKFAGQFKLYSEKFSINVKSDEKDVIALMADISGKVSEQLLDWKKSRYTEKSDCFSYLE